MSTLSPSITTKPVEISHFMVKSGYIAIVRDDMLEGGTKQRAAIPYLIKKSNQGITEVVYASPFSGFAQIAIAISCKQINVKATIFAERDKTRTAKHPSSYTNFISNFSNVRLTDSLEEAEQAASAYANESCSRYKIPLGLNDPCYRQCLYKALLTQWRILCNKLSYVPEALWLPVGSGTLAETFREVVPPDVKLICVDVGVLPAHDPRIKRVMQLPNSQYLKAPEQFVESVRNCPPIPSNPFYDAKLWQFVAAKAGPHDVWWNVA